MMLILQITMAIVSIPITIYVKGPTVSLSTSNLHQPYNYSEICKNIKVIIEERKVPNESDPYYSRITKILDNAD
jgi:hypothetical protein